MLKIAVVGNHYQYIKRFIEYKFKEKIDRINKTASIYYLKNGDEIHLCYEEENRDRYKSAIYDAIIVTPEYESLLDVIRHRCERV